MRDATLADISSIQRIYNEGIVDRVATLDTEPKDDVAIWDWFAAHGGRYTILVAHRDGEIVGWVCLNRYSLRKAYDGVADLSIYVSRAERGTGIGKRMLLAIEDRARSNQFHKIILSTFRFNAAGQRLYAGAGYREVGVFRNQGQLDGEYVDVVVMEKLLTPFSRT